MQNTPTPKALVAVLLLLVLLGCSFGFLYRQLDWLVPWYVSDYMTLDSTQSSELERRVVQQLDWHCRTQLSRYAEWFETLHNNPQAFSREQLEQHYLTSRLYWKTLMERVAVDASRILVTASDTQLDELLHNLERKNRRLESEYQELTPAERVAQREERLTRILERWLGELTTAQTAQVEQWAQQVGAFSAGEWVNNRKNWQQRFVSSVRQADSPQELEEQLVPLFAEPEQLWSEPFRREYQRSLDLTLDMLAEVAADMNTEQRAHLDMELVSWIEQFESLSCTPMENTKGAAVR